MILINISEDRSENLPEFLTVSPLSKNCGAVMADSIFVYRRLINQKKIKLNF